MQEQACFRWSSIDGPLTKVVEWSVELRKQRQEQDGVADGERALRDALHGTSHPLCCGPLQATQGYGSAGIKQCKTSVHSAALGFAA